MTKHYARIENERVAEIVALPDNIAPGQAFHASIADAMVPCPVDAAPGMAYRDGAFAPYVPPAPSAEERQRRLHNETSARIFAVLSDATQKNLTAYAADLALRGDLSASEHNDVAVMRAARGWIMGMLVACRVAVEDGTEPVWPPVPADVPALAQRF